MPGTYAQIMLDAYQAGRWPLKFISLMLHYREMHNNHEASQHSQQRLKIEDENGWASCHPNAIMFMNVVSNAGYENDDTVGTMAEGQQAANYVNAGRTALALDNKAIWVKYGSSENHSHSIVLLTGRANQVECFEGWAGKEEIPKAELEEARRRSGNPNLTHRDRGYQFHWSVQQADELGGARNRQRPTRAEARTALEDMISDAVAEREDGWDRLSRSSAEYAPRQNEHAEIRVEAKDMVSTDAFRDEVKRRMKAVGYYAAASVEKTHNFQQLVCCHCQAVALSRDYASGAHWRECVMCIRHYCSSCAQHVLANNVCDCGEDTAAV